MDQFYNMVIQHDTTYYSKGTCLEKGHGKTFFSLFFHHFFCGPHVVLPTKTVRFAEARIGFRRPKKYLRLRPLGGELPSVSKQVVGSSGTVTRPPFLLVF